MSTMQDDERLSHLIGDIYDAALNPAPPPAKSGIKSR
jgi:hypothetical protein